MGKWSARYLAGRYIRKRAERHSLLAAIVDSQMTQSSTGI
jgi:hypothetical protein